MGASCGKSRPPPEAPNGTSGRGNRPGGRPLGRQAEPGETSDFALAFSAIPVEAVQAWWQQGPDSFTHAFQVFAAGLEGGFVFAMCDPLADFARLAVTVTRNRSSSVRPSAG